MTKSKDKLAKYDLSSVLGVFTGAAPLGKETAEDLQRIFPSWAVRQGYGMYLLMSKGSGSDLCRQA